MESEHEQLTLSPADAVEADALLNGGPSADPARRARVAEWLKVLEASPMPEPAGDLAVRTLAAVQAERMKLGPTERQTGEPAAHGRPTGASTLGGRPTRASAPQWRRRLAEFGAMAVAAMLLLAVTFEGLGTARRSAARVACQANMQKIGQAFTQYAGPGDEGTLPMLAMPANQNWLHGNAAGGTAAMNNAANLLPLVTGQYLAVKSLFCAGAGVPNEPITLGKNELPAIGYSYRNLYGPEKPRWDGLKTTLVLADKNPIFGTEMHPELAQQNSPNHDGKGTYVLRADGSATWEISPNIGPDRDNIWTLGTGKERLAVYTGREVPQGLKDVFMCP